MSIPTRKDVHDFMKALVISQSAAIRLRSKETKFLMVAQIVLTLHLHSISIWTVLAIEYPVKLKNSYS